MMDKIASGLVVSNLETLTLAVALVREVNLAERLL